MANGTMVNGDPYLTNMPVHNQRDPTGATQRGG